MLAAKGIKTKIRKFQDRKMYMDPSQIPKGSKVLGFMVREPTMIIMSPETDRETAWPGEEGVQSVTKAVYVEVTPEEFKSTGGTSEGANKLLEKLMPEVTKELKFSKARLTSAENEKFQAKKVRDSEKDDRKFQATKSINKAKWLDWNEGAQEVFKKNWNELTSDEQDQVWSHMEDRHPFVHAKGDKDSELGNISEDELNYLRKTFGMEPEEIPRYEAVEAIRDRREIHHKKKFQARNFAYKDPTEEGLPEPIYKKDWGAVKGKAEDVSGAVGEKVSEFREKIKSKFPKKEFDESLPESVVSKDWKRVKEGAKDFGVKAKEFGSKAKEFGSEAGEFFKEQEEVVKQRWKDVEEDRLTKQRAKELKEYEYWRR